MMNIEQCTIIVPQHWAINPETVEIEVALDMDDILWPYIAKIAKSAGLRLEDWYDFYVPNNPWPATLRQQVDQLLLDVEFFRDIDFFDGIEDILKPQELGVKVKVKTRSIRAEIGKLKKLQLKQAIPALREENLEITLVKLHEVGPKHLAPHTIVFADDNPYTLAKSTATTNATLRWPWNTSNSARRLLANKRPIYVDSLRELNRFIYYRTLNYLRTGR